jgi:uncharacterized membrane protein HdeD (DUF308 family)
MENEGVMKSWVWLMIAGVIALVAGVLALANPLAATITALVMTAWGFIALGATEVIGTFLAEGWKAKLWSLLLGVVFLLMGASLMKNPLAGMMTLTWLVGILFAVSGVTKIILAFAARQTPYFWALLLSGAVSVVLAGMIFSNFPYSAATVLGALLAVELISSGIANIALSLRVKELAGRSG